MCPTEAASPTSAEIIPGAALCDVKTKSICLGYKARVCENPGGTNPGFAGDKLRRSSPQTSTGSGSA